MNEQLRWAYWTFCSNTTQISVVGNFASVGHQFSRLCTVLPAADGSVMRKPWWRQAPRCTQARLARRFAGQKVALEEVEPVAIYLREKLESAALL